MVTSPLFFYNMKTYYVDRNSKMYGPYEPQQLAEMVKIGKLLKQDRVVEEQPAVSTFMDKKISVGDVLNLHNIKVAVDNEGSLLEQAKQVGSRIWFSKDIYKWSEIKKDSRLMLLGIIGLAPLVAMHILPDIDIVTFYAIALYFSCIWGVFFYHMFKTKQVDLKLTAWLFFAVQVLMFFVWNMGLNRLNLFYAFVDNGGLISNSLGYILGVGVTEELVKAIPLIVIATRAKKPLIPQTMVFYGVMCGIGFGVYEGVEYQMEVNRQLDYNSSFFMNIARLTSLPFFHSMCSGLAGYFISFAVLKPRYRQFLYFLAIAMPAVLHGLYDTFADSILSLFFGFSVVLLLNYYVNNDKAVQQALNE